MVEARPEQKLIDISYKQYELIMKKMVTKIKARLGKKLDKVPGVYGIPRGGVPIAVHLSHNLGIPMLEEPEENCLVIEDISDSGNTLLPYRNEGYFIVAIFCKEKTKVVPNVYFKIVAEEDWIVFPWETKPRVKK